GNTTITCTWTSPGKQMLKATGLVGVVGNGSGGNFTATFKPGSVAVNKGRSASVGVTATNSSGAPVNVNVQATSADPAVATAQAQGTGITVTGVGEGTTQVNVTVTAAGGSGFQVGAATLDTYSFHVTVFAATSTVAVQPNPVNLTIGGTQQLSTLVNGSPGTTSGYISYSQSVARVDNL